MSSDPNDGWVEILGTLDEASIVVPQTAMAGVPFVIELTTKGDGCGRAGRTIVRKLAGRMEIEPRDLIPSPPPQSCNLFPYAFGHNVAVQYDQRDTVIVAIRGLVENLQSGTRDTVAIQYSVFVR